MSILPTKSGWIHFPLGILNVCLIAFHLPLGIIFAVGFISYEFIQEYCAMRQKGQSHYDIGGWLWGLVAGAGAWGIFRLINHFI